MFSDKDAATGNEPPTPVHLLNLCAINESTQIKHTVYKGATKVLPLLYFVDTIEVLMPV